MSTAERRTTAVPLWVKIATPVLGNIGLGLINVFFDWVVLPGVTFFFYLNLGVIEGGISGIALLTILFCIVNWFFVRFYDYTKTDWLGLEILKVWRDKKAQQTETRGLRQLIIAHLGDMGVFLTFSLYDPLYATLYLRKGIAKYNGFSRRDWIIMCTSTCYAVTVGSLLWLAGFEFIRYIRIIPLIIEWVLGLS